MKDANLEHAMYLFDSFREGLDFPHSVFPTSVFASGNITRYEQLWEWRVDDEEVLIRLDWTGLGDMTCAL